jgi:hypothetical protein
MTAPHPRTSSAPTKALLLAAGLCAFALTAAAAAQLPPQTVTTTPVPQGLGRDSPVDHPAPPSTPPRRTEGKDATKFGYFNDPKSESDCYYVFGELRCDRVPKHEPRPEPK